MKNWRQNLKMAKNVDFVPFEKKNGANFLHICKFSRRKSHENLTYELQNWRKFIFAPKIANISHCEMAFFLKLNWNESRISKREMSWNKFRLF